MGFSIREGLLASVTHPEGACQEEGGLEAAPQHQGDDDAQA